MRLTRPNDPLLTATKFAAIAMKIVLGIGIGVVVSVLPVILLNQDAVAAQLVKDGKAIGVDGLIAGIAVALPMIAVVLVGAFWFVHLLGRIVDTVGEGDPFIPANADRLRTMGWLALAIQLLTLPIGLAVARIARAVEDSPSDTSVGLDFTGLVLVLILFVLARIFRKGAAMREELEGTV
ncbi:MAG: DUF2975 domain-containing protein [Novosphingobium sp.]|nr:DUF2975 domain-containing protein [Novosphingobium sp.]